MIKRETIIETARSWVGVRYRHQGRTRDKGIDCIGLIWVVWNDLGLPPVNIPATYSQSPKGAMLLTHTDQHLITPERKDKQDYRPGDILVLWGWVRAEPQHFAIVGEHGGRITMIHAWSKHGKVVEHPIDEFWQRRVERIHEFPGTEG